MLNFYFSDNYKGEGISAGLERGLLVDFNDKCIVQEGMGLGAPAIKSKNGTYFSSSSKVTTISSDEYLKEFIIDSELVWEIFRTKSDKFKELRILTVFINKLSDFYKKFPKYQNLLLKMGIFSRDFFQTKSRMINVGPLGKIRFKYKIMENRILIDVDFSSFIKQNKRRISKICLLNELGGDYFNYCKIGKEIFTPPSGWVKINEKNENKLYSKELKIEFKAEIVEKTPNLKYDLVFGREKISNFCWAGFDVEIEVKSIKNFQSDCKIKYICEFNTQED